MKSRRAGGSKTIVGRAAKRTMKQRTGVGLVPLESDDQKALVQYLDTLGVGYGQGTLWDYSYAVPNASKLAGSADQRAKMMNTMKAQGLKTGVSDLVIAFPAGPYHGAYLELKRVKGGSIAADQAIWCRRMRSAGHFADIVVGFDEARAFVDAYYHIWRGAAPQYSYKFEPRGSIEEYLRGEQ